MEQIRLANTARETTRLGFGCSSIMGATGRRKSLRILDAAYDAGIRHFDVAPMYGYGEAERCLGEFLQRHRSGVTVTTKYGIPPANHSHLLRLGRRAAEPILRHLPALKRPLARAANSAATHNQIRPAFSATQAAASLQRSLAALRTSHIDLWLLHEVTASDLQDDGLLRFLEDQIASGTIGDFGIGSSADKIDALFGERPAYCHVMQYDWSVLDPIIPPSNIFRIHHRALTSNFRSLHTALLQSGTVCQRWSQAVDADLAHPKHLARLMLKAALVLNPASIILVSSKDPAHIQANVETASDASLEAPSQELYRLVQTEIGQLLPATKKGEIRKMG